MALTRFGLRLTASGSQDADLGSTGEELNLQNKSIALSKAMLGLDPYPVMGHAGPLASPHVDRLPQEKG